MEAPEGSEKKHSRETCGPCRRFDPPWSFGKVTSPGVAPTPSELEAGMLRLSDQLAQREEEASALKTEWPPGSMEFRHADEWRLKFRDERRLTDADGRKWRSYIEAHPELAHLPITTLCRHQVDAHQFPACWDGEAGLYVREVGDDDDMDGTLALPYAAVAGRR
jgi:hypothetical protein